MIVTAVSNVLQNIEDNFYYCGVEISKKHFDITEFSKVCNKINNFKNYISNEKGLYETKQKFNIVIKDQLVKNIELYLFISKDKFLISLFDNNKKEIIPLTQNIYDVINDKFIKLISYHLNILIKQTKNNIIQPIDNTITNIKNIKEIIYILNYQENIEKLSNCFYHTYELEFINGYKDYIFTDEELNNSLKEI